MGDLFWRFKLRCRLGAYPVDSSSFWIPPEYWDADDIALLMSDTPDRTEGLPRTRITKKSCACDCGRGPVSVGAFFFLLSSSFFFLLSSSLTQIRALKSRFS